MKTKTHKINKTLVYNLFILLRFSFSPHALLGGKPKSPIWFKNLSKVSWFWSTLATTLSWSKSARTAQSQWRIFRTCEPHDCLPTHTVSFMKKSASNYKCIEATIEVWNQTEMNLSLSTDIDKVYWIPSAVTFIPSTGYSEALKYYAGKRVRKPLIIFNQKHTQSSV